MTNAEKVIDSITDLVSSLVEENQELREQVERLTDLLAKHEAE